MSSGKSIFRMLLLLLAVAVALPLIACETPVYRYAMYRWAPAPFEVYFFHTGELAEDEKELHAELLSMAEDDESPLNCSLLSIDLGKVAEKALIVATQAAEKAANKKKAADEALTKANEELKKATDALKVAEEALVAATKAAEEAANQKKAADEAASNDADNKDLAAAAEAAGKAAEDTEKKRQEGQKVVDDAKKKVEADTAILKTSDEGKKKGDADFKDLAAAAEAAGKAAEGAEKKRLKAQEVVDDPKIDPELIGILPDIKALWEANKDLLRNGYLVTNPHGAVIHMGPLDQSDLVLLSSSPARMALSSSLQEGHAIVFILLKGNDLKANQESAAVLKQLCQDVEDGKINLYSVPQDPAAREDVASQQAEGSPSPMDPGHRVTFIEVDRDDKAEKFLVVSLLAVESDLEEITHPMVFPVYGRARALVPYIGKGVTRDNLLDCLEFVTGACSCTVKEQNPGIDLLVRFDWETAAAQIADRFGSEEGNESQFGGEDFFPEIIFGPAASTDIEQPDTGDSTAQASPVSDTDNEELNSATKATGVATIGLLLGVFLLVVLLLSVFVLRPR